MTWLALVALLLQAGGINPEAREYLRQAEALIDTDKAYSQEQADLFEKALALEPGLASARFNVAIVYLSLESYEKAEFHLSKLIGLEPSETRGLLLRAEVYLTTGRPGLAIPDLKLALEKDPSEITAWRHLGRAQFQLNDFTQSLASLTRFRELDPDDQEVELDLGFVKQSLQQSAAAAKHFRRFLERHPDDVDVHLLAARALQDEGELEASLEHYLKAEELRPEDTELRKETAYLYLEMNRPEEADERLQEGEPGATDLANRALIAQSDKRLLDAEVAMRRAVSMEPDNAAFWVQLGGILFLARQHESAAQAYGRSLELGITSPAVYRTLGTIHANLKQPEKAREFLEKGLSLEPDDSLLHFHLAVVLERLEQPTAARDHFLRALKNGSDNARIHFRLAVLFSRDGESDAALQHLKSALETEPEKYLPFLERELLNVHSDFDSIRYSVEFSQMLERTRERAQQQPQF